MANQFSSASKKEVSEDLYNFTSSRTSTLSLDQTRSSGSSCSLWKYVSPPALNPIFPLSASGFLLWNGLIFDYFSTTHPGIPESMGIECKTNIWFSFHEWQRRTDPKHSSMVIRKKYLRRFCSTKFDSSLLIFVFRDTDLGDCFVDLGFLGGGQCLS